MSSIGKGFGAGIGFVLGIIAVLVALPLIFIAGCGGLAAIFALSHPPQSQTPPPIVAPEVTNMVNSASWRESSNTGPPVPAVVSPAAVPAPDPKVIEDANLLHWQRQEADGGNAAQQYNLGVRYLNGAGVAKDPQTARAWFAKAAAQGDPDALAELSNSPTN